MFHFRMPKDYKEAITHHVEEHNRHCREMDYLVKRSVVKTLYASKEKSDPAKYIHNSICSFKLNGTAMNQLIAEELEKVLEYTEERGLLFKHKVPRIKESYIWKDNPEKQLSLDL